MSGYDGADIRAARDSAMKALVNRHREEYDVLYAAALDSLDRSTCRVCGRPRPDGPRRVTCGRPWCKSAWQALRFVVDAQQRERACARKGITAVGEWIVRGDEGLQFARDCIERGLPIAAEFPRGLLDRLASDLASAS